MVTIKSLNITENMYKDSLPEEFIKSKKKVHRRINEMSNKYNLDNSLFTLICWRHIDNMANSILDEGNSSTEGAFTRACTWFNQDSDKDLVIMYQEYLDEEGKDILNSLTHRL
jgi:hypothetical protein